MNISIEAGEFLQTGMDLYNQHSDQETEYYQH